MNHLAHIYLSGKNEGLIIGNYIADHIRGNQLGHLPEEIQSGVRLHRTIDTYTDKHQIFRATTKLIMPSLRKFSGVAVDIYFDYFLANKWKHYHEEDLETFALNTYSLIESNWTHIPERGKRFFTYMIEHNLLLNYGDLETLNRVFMGIDSRTKFDTNLTDAVTVLSKHHDEIETNFEEFFLDLMQFVKEQHE